MKMVQRCTLGGKGGRRAWRVKGIGRGGVARGGSMKGWSRKGWNRKGRGGDVGRFGGARGDEGTRRRVRSTADSGRAASVCSNDGQNDFGPKHGASIKKLHARSMVRVTSIK